MLTPAQRVYHYRRKSPEDYATWFANAMDLTETDALRAAGLRNRELIEEAVLSASAKEVFKAESQEIYRTESEETESIPNSEEFPAELTYDSMTLNELREECKSRGLPYYGTKAEVALRLKRDDEGITEPTATTEAPAEAAAEEEPDAPAEEAAVTEVDNHDRTEGQNTDTEAEERTEA